VDREFEALIDGFALSLGAENKAPRSVEIYSDAVTQFVGWLGENAGRALVGAGRIEIRGFIDQAVGQLVGLDGA